MKLQRFSLRKINLKMPSAIRRPVCFRFNVLIRYQRFTGPVYPTQFARSWWRHQMETFPRYWLFVEGINMSPVNSPNKGQRHEALMFSLICDWIKDWVNSRKAGDLRCHRNHYDVIVMPYTSGGFWCNKTHGMENLCIFLGIRKNWRHLWH